MSHIESRSRRVSRLVGICLGLCLSLCLVRGASAAEKTFRLYQGIAAYVNNPQGKDFEVALGIRDLNLYADGPRELMVKIYDPSGKPVVREFVEDDGIVTDGFGEPLGGWDHELQYLADLRSRGVRPMLSWNTLTSPAYLSGLVQRTRRYTIKGGQKGVYRVVLSGDRDHVVTMNLSPDLKYGVVGHHTWILGSGDMYKKSYLYVPKGTSGLHMVFAEPAKQLTRTFKLSTAGGEVIFEGKAQGTYRETGGKEWKDSGITFGENGEYDGKLLTMEVSSGGNDYLMKVAFQQPKKGVFADYVGMASLAVFAPDQETALALRGGTTESDGEVFWHPFQVRFQQWLKANPAGTDEKGLALRKDIQQLYDYFRLIGPGDARGTATWTNLAYAFGYYGCKIWRLSWVLMQRDDLPDDLRAITNEGLIMGGDRLSFAIGMTRVNGNSFSQIPVGLWYCHRTTKDPMQKDRFELFYKRWVTGGWGKGVGISPSGDSQEHFAHDANYGCYIMNNWRPSGGTWVDPGILADAADDPRWAKVMDRYYNLYSYLACRRVDGGYIGANPWSTRTHSPPQTGGNDWESAKHRWKGEPGEAFTVNVNDGSEWFAARRKNYYMLTFHGRLAPKYVSSIFNGQLGFGGGVICQLTVPGKGPVLASTLHGSYGSGMHPSQWRNFHIHSLVGEMWDGSPLVAGISEHENAALKGNVVSSSGEVADNHVKISRKYTYNADSIDCEFELSTSDYESILSIWSHGRKWSQVREAYEMIPFLTSNALSVTVADGKELTKDLVTTQRVKIDLGGYGVIIALPAAMPVKLGESNTVMIQLTAKEVPAESIKLNYKLTPFGN